MSRFKNQTKLKLEKPLKKVGTKANKTLGFLRRNFNISSAFYKGTSL